MPRLNPRSEDTSVPPLRPRSPSSEANARPWTRPKPAAITASPPGTKGLRAWVADTRIETAIRLSTTRLGGGAGPHAAGGGGGGGPAAHARTTGGPGFTLARAVSRRGQRARPPDH